MQPHEPIKVRMERLSLAWRAIPVSIVATLVNALLLIYLNRAWASTTLQYSWMACLILLQLARLLSLQYAKSRLNQIDSADRLERLFNIGVWLTAMVWAIAAWTFTPGESTAHQAFTAVVFAGLVSGAMSSLLSIPNAYRAYVVILIVPLVARLVYLGGDVQLALALLISLFMLFVLANGQRQFLVLQDSLLFRFRSEELTEHLETEKAATEYLNQTLEETQIDARLGSWHWDKCADRISGSRSFYTVFGFAETEPLGMEQLITRVDIDDRALFEKLLQQIQNDNQVVHFEHRINIGEDYRVIYERWHWKPAQGNDGPALNAICQDITPLKVADRLKDEFVATVSHELRTPLTSIIGSLGILRHEKLSQVANQKEMLDIAYANSKRLQTLIDDLLDVSKIESGKLSMNLIPLPLSEVVDETVLINRAYAEKFKVRVKIENDLPVPEPLVVADENRLIQVINNLLSNAIKFSQHQGQVRIVLEMVGDRVRVSVVDQGPGFDKDFKKDIFNKFTQYRTHDVNQKQPGTGLGLSIAKAIVEQMGGLIDCESELAVGSTFYFELPSTSA